MTKNLFFIFVAILFFLQLNAAQNVYPLLFHNDFYNIQKAYYPNNAEYKRTIQQMSALGHKYHKKVFFKTAKQLIILKKRSTYYFNLEKKLTNYYKKKWSKPNYINMDENWKNKTYKKHKSKLKKLYSLTQAIQKAYMTWNNQRNEAVKNSGKELIKKMTIAFKNLKKALKEEKKLEKQVFQEISKELEIIKLM